MSTTHVRDQSLPVDNWVMLGGEMLGGDHVLPAVQYQALPVYNSARVPSQVSPEPSPLSDDVHDLSSRYMPSLSQMAAELSVQSSVGVMPPRRCKATHPAYVDKSVKDHPSDSLEFAQVIPDEDPNWRTARSMKQMPVNKKTSNGKYRRFTITGLNLGRYYSRFNGRTHGLQSLSVVEMIRKYRRFTMEGHSLGSNFF